MIVFRSVVAILTLFAGQALVVALIAAVRKRSNIYALILLVAVLSTPLVFGLEPLFFGRPLDPDGRLFFALTNLTLGGFLFHFMTLPDRSVTLRVLAELERAPNRTLSLAELTAKYSVREMIESRLEQLAEGNFLTIEPDGRLTLKSRGTTFGRFVARGRRLFGIASAN
jgi:hypothetical protein